MSPEQPETATVRAPAKVNLALSVGSADALGFHPLLTAFQALDMWDQVSVTESDSMAITCQAPFDTSSVPLDHTNLAWRAHSLLTDLVGELPPVAIEIRKNIPVAGGMAGGSADAAAALIALNSLWDLSVDSTDLHNLSRALGSDVPFALIGGQAIGRGRGDVLQPVRVERPLHVVVITTNQSLSTPTVYQELDRIRGNEKPALADGLDEAFLTAWRAGDASGLSGLMQNDLEFAAFSLMPSLQATRDALLSAGAIGAMVSGSGPSVFGLADSAEKAEAIAATMVAQGYRAVATQSTNRGTELV